MSQPTQRVLIIGAGGQLGTELAPELAKRFGPDNIIVSDLRKLDTPYINVELNVLDHTALEQTIVQYGVTQIYHLAAILSAKGEEDPQRAWQINMQGLMHVLELADKHALTRVFWPSSIAVYGPNTPKLAPQYGERDPETIYGITKLAGERLCAWYQTSKGLDVRSLRYPGLISYKAPPGGGTTDYAVDVFHALQTGDHYTSFLRKTTALPMMYMPDAVRATLELMQVPHSDLQLNGAYNVGALSFTPEALFATIQKRVPRLTADYHPDYRQTIADTWPNDVDDAHARADWNWQPEYDLEAMVDDIIANLLPAHSVTATPNV